MEQQAKCAPEKTRYAGVGSTERAFNTRNKNHI
jgi:hypothetical protein